MNRSQPLSLSCSFLLAAFALAVSAVWFSAPPARDAARPRVAAEADWLARAQDYIAESEYRPSESGGGLQAPNRAHNLRTWFEPSGVRVQGRTAADAPELLTLRLAGVGREGRLAPVAEGRVVYEGNRVEIRRPGLTEWYLNSAAGLEQGFTLMERPAGEGALVLDLGVARAKASLRGQDIVLATDSGRRLQYGGLVATDARGHVLVAQLDAPRPDRIRLVVNDTRAAYPVVIDPLLTQIADTQLEGDQSGVRLGENVAGAGDVNGDGYADVIVGAAFYDNGETDEGSAFVFLGSATGIADGSPATAAHQLEANQAFARLGGSVAGAGDVNGDGYDDVIVGASGYQDGPGSEFDEGAAFVFHGKSSGIEGRHPGQAATQLEANQAQASMGSSVAGAGDVNGDGYDDVIVGAIEYSAGQNEEGAAFIFLGSATGVADGNPATAATQLESDQIRARMGKRVSGAGDVDGDGYDDVIVGADRYDAGETDEGAAFIFLGSATGVADATPATAATQLESDEEDAWMGGAVGGAGDVNGDGYGDVIVGAYRYDSPTTDEGAAFVFLGSATGVPDGGPGTADTRLESNQTSSSMGWSVAGAGDVDGDGYDDVIVGALSYDFPESNEGSAFIFLGSAAGVANGNPATAAARVESDQDGARLGVSVAGAGDVDGDGYDDVIVGAYLYDAGNTDEGLAFIYAGGPLPPDCSDGLDNDGDGSTDHPADDDCADPLDTTESPTLPACSDGKDNDEDGHTDHPADPQCKSAGANNEKGTCGLGGEVLLVLLPLWAHARRRTARQPGASPRT